MTVYLLRATHLPLIRTLIYDKPCVYVYGFGKIYHLLQSLLPPVELANTCRVCCSLQACYYPYYFLLLEVDDWQEVDNGQEVDDGQEGEVGCGKRWMTGRRSMAGRLAHVSHAYIRLHQVYC